MFFFRVFGMPVSDLSSFGMLVSCADVTDLLHGFPVSVENGFCGHTLYLTSVHLEEGICEDIKTSLRHSLDGLNLSSWS
jgi:hypothetical protein